MISAGPHSVQCSTVEWVDTVPSGSPVVSRLSTRMTLPCATLMFSLQEQSGGGAWAEMHSGKVSASSEHHSISTTGRQNLDIRLVIERVDRRGDFGQPHGLAVLWDRRRRGCTVFGPITSSKMSTSPAFRFPSARTALRFVAPGRLLRRAVHWQPPSSGIQWSVSVAEVAPRAKQHSQSPQV